MFTHHNLRIGRRITKLRWSNEGGGWDRRWT